ncbi:MAG: sugar phosphate isomerase/epimerase [Lentisphaeria bacterium]|nr:sugar phosphate isomerase/epimerase [Lentisphaeria bacterium]
MFLTGFADEAGADLEVQIRATRELGWKYIESRMIGKTMLGTMSDAEFEDAFAKLEAAGIKINCYGSAVANWAKDPRREEDFQKSVDELRTAIPRMRRLGCNLLRGMSFAMVSDADPESPELEAMVFHKVRYLVELCADNGIVYGHENCMNYGGYSHKHTLKLLEKVDHDNLKLIYDTGNPTFNYRRIGTPPYPLQSSWEFYRNVRDHIVYVHIKDGLALPKEGETHAVAEYTYAGDGAGDVRAIVKDLLRTGYDGGFSIEPHLGCVFHDGNAQAGEDGIRYQNYVNYGRRFEKLLTECGWTLPEK